MVKKKQSRRRREPPPAPGRPLGPRRWPTAQSPAEPPTNVSGYASERLQRETDERLKRELEEDAERARRGWGYSTAPGGDLYLWQNRTSRLRHPRLLPTLALILLLAAASLTIWWLS
jgi:hypothetical protein